MIVEIKDRIVPTRRETDMANVTTVRTNSSSRGLGLVAAVIVLFVAASFFFGWPANWDDWKTAAASKPDTAFVTSDSDFDGLSNDAETGTWNTDPNNRDTDGDGRTDGDETNSGSNPLVYDVAPGTSPSPAPTPSQEPGTPNPTPAPGATTAPGGQDLIGNSFNPIPFYSQSCAPEDGSCTWDVGAMGRHYNEPLSREVVQIGIVKGWSVSWNGQSNGGGNNGCALVVLRPNSWFENITVVDANVTVYEVWQGDIEGWLKTLAVQSAQEQSADYGCPTKDFSSIPQWGSEIESPPCGVEGFANCGEGTGSNTDSGTPGMADDTHGDNGLARHASADSGGVASFKKGESVNGWKIVIGGKTYQNCHFESAPGDGKVTDGVVNYWNAEVKTSSC